MTDHLTLRNPCVHLKSEQLSMFKKTQKHQDISTYSGVRSETITLRLIYPLSPWYYL